MENNRKGENSPLKKLGGNILIFAIGSFACKLMGYVMLPFYTSVLSQAEYGAYDIVLTTSNLLMPIFTLLITEATFRFALDKENDSRKVFTLSVYTVSVGLLVYVAFSPLILLSKAYKQYYLHFIIYHVLSTLHTLLSQYCKGISKTKEYAVCGIIGTAVILFSNVLLMSVLHMGLMGYFISSYLGTIFSCIYLAIKCDILHSIVPITKKDSPLFVSMLRYSIPIMPNSISWWISTSSDKYIISWFAGQDQVGLYSVAYKIPSLMTMFTTIFFSAWQISSVDDFGSEESKYMFSTVYKMFFSVVVLVSCGIIVFSKIITSILFAQSYFDAWRFVPYLVVAYVFHDLAAFMGSIYTAGKNTKMLFYSTLAGAGINIVLNCVFISRYGAVGGAITTLISYFAVYVIRRTDIKRIMEFQIGGKRNTICLALLCLEMIICELGSKISFVLNLCCFAVMLCLQYSTIKNIIIKVFRKGAINA